MARPTEDPPAPGPWQSARVVAAWPETASARSLRLALARPTPYLPGQHFVVRLTAADGYRATRSYSAASAPAPDARRLELTVERLPNGEVSPFLCDVLAVGDRLEVRGPIGAHFVWDGSRPALAIGGGSGVVPLMAMLRHARRLGTSSRLRLVVSTRAPDTLYYPSELAGPEVTVAFSRRAPAGTLRPPGRLGTADLAPLVSHARVAFVAGSEAFVEHVTALLVELGVAAGAIRTERFGPSR
jgi:ferredoxin-NADP reductase